MTGLVASYHGTTLEFTKLLRATHSQMFVEAACRLGGLMLYTCDLDGSGKNDGSTVYFIASSSAFIVTY